MKKSRRFITRSDKVFYKVDRETLWKKQNGTCAYCKQVITLAEATMDHVIAISKVGYVHNTNNCVVACGPCNKKKAHYDKPKLTKFEKLLQESVLRLEKRIRRAEYNLDMNAHFSFKKWEKFHEKRGKWMI